ncbi:MAG TPA: DUF1453 domain-containing protein [Thermoanaerobaculia bacterium]|nr:DUF1453 domain-containing protein [Thermoanaerobaculia bacterium]
MPLVGLLLALVLLFALAVLSIPLSIVQRYRMGTMRRQARGWVATINLVAIALSAAILLFIAALSSLWVPDAIPFTLAGLASGAVLGLLGLALTRWTAGPGTLHYAPNRWLVLSITLVVLARLLYGFWRGWSAWQAGGEGNWLAEAGAAGSMGAGAVVIGYYLVYWAGLRLRISRLRSAEYRVRRVE